MGASLALDQIHRTRRRRALCGAFTIVYVETLAFAGFSTDLEAAKIRRTGMQPIPVVLIAHLTVGTVSLLVLLAVLG
ncbi:hypothetical protein [Halosolutus halophilus]|uniref:hypothetical protein n=1 Tax=Halosolutus halophilus TaxID=1552990 RepID=UPI0022351688|nr:hypothetical protein [Halosolutus halophilus]